MTESLYSRAAELLEQVRELSGGRTRLMAVVKTRSMKEVREVARAGVTLFGENRAQELPVHFGLPVNGEVHFIGTLQQNKARLVLSYASMVESLDSEPLAAELDRRAGMLGRVLPVLAEVNIAGEAVKGGIPPDELPGFLERVCALPHLRVEGLMTIGPAGETPDQHRRWFEQLRLLRDRCQNADCPLETLSMGMSADYIQAIEEGATIVRVGSALFGPRSNS